MTPLLTLALALFQGDAQQTGFPGTPVGHVPKVEIAWNRFYDLDALYAHFDRLVAAYPTYVRSEVIGRTIENREVRVYTLNDPATGKDTEKPAMWIDGNVHGNEVQAGEEVLYTLWYLLENRSTNAEIGKLVAGSAFYLCPSQNPDGRAHWFERAHNASSSRTGVQPWDDDDDGLFDEDPANDLDGDGMITRLRKYVPGQGTHRMDPDDPRILDPVPANDEGKKGDWVMLGEEGIDDDGDGRINEDEVGGYDMNRAWPSMWQPEHVQFGAGPYPLYWPEARSVATFILAHSNIAALQSFHNAGGMILRGPGAESYGEYERDDVRVFDELGKAGEKMLPFYRYMILWKDLYTVYGGFATWGYEGLGIISFTNELWNSEQQWGDGKNKPDPKQAWFFDDKLLSGAGFVDWHPFDHPFYGKVEIGGFRKDYGRVPPTFMIEEMLHRNAMFNISHAKAMPLVTINDATATALGDGLLAVDVVFRNLHAIPTRTAHAAKHKIGEPDAFTIAGKDIEILAGGFRTDRWRPERITLAEREPARLLRENGIGSREDVRVRWFVRGKGDRAVVSWQGEKARDQSLEIKLR
jgi:hypothetical protein